MKRFFVGLIVILGFSIISNGQSTKINIKTSEGDILVMLYDETPIHRDNFIKLAKSGFYNDLLFHRVIKGFMIQVGDPESKNAPANKMLGSGGPGYTLEAEIVQNSIDSGNKSGKPSQAKTSSPKYIHKKGALAAARLGDNMNPERRSSGSQFYIVQGNIYTDMQLDSFEKQSGNSYTKEQRDAYTTIGGTPHLDNQYTVFGEIIDGMKIVDKIANTQTRPGERPLKDIKIISTTIVK